MVRLKSLLVVGSLLFAAACSGGSGGGGVPGGGGGSSNVIASFAGESNPAPNEVAMAQGQRSGDTVVVEVRLGAVSGLFGAAFDLTYDAAQVDFVSWAPGTLLEQGGHTPIYQVGAGTPGRLVVAATRTGSGTVNASASALLLRLTFRVEDVGNSALDFSGSPILADGQTQPQPLPSIRWSGGTLFGS
jgi:hypothetical protein